jgi:hypothetical protein
VKHGGIINQLAAGSAGFHLKNSGFCWPNYSLRRLDAVRLCVTSMRGVTAGRIPPRLRQPVQGLAVTIKRPGILVSSQLSAALLCWPCIPAWRMIRSKCVGCKPCLLSRGSDATSPMPFAVRFCRAEERLP